MQLKNDGSLAKGEQYKPAGSEWKVQDVQYHHMIPWWVLRDFWNAFVSKVKPVEGKWLDVGHHKVEMEQYMRIFGFTGNINALSEAIRKGRLAQQPMKDVDD